LIISGFKRRRAGLGPREDHKKEVGTVNTDHKAEYKRWRGIVQNDLENIPIAVIIAYFSVYGADIYVFLVAYSLFAFLRILHTVFYAFALQPLRSIAWVLGVICVLVYFLNGIVGSWHRDRSWFDVTRTT